MESYVLLTLTVAAAGALQACRFVGHDGAIAGENANTLGVARMGVADGGDETVDVIGLVPVETGGAFAVGDRLSCDADGRAVATDDVTYTKVVAIAREASTAAGEFRQALLVVNPTA